MDTEIICYSILIDQPTKAVEERVERCYCSVAWKFEVWIKRRKSWHTQRSYRQDVMDEVAFLKLKWPEESSELLAVSVRRISCPPESGRVQYSSSFLAVGAPVRRVTFSAGCGNESGVSCSLPLQAE
jgi:hypothetical protein